MVWCRPIDRRNHRIEAPTVTTVTTIVNAVWVIAKIALDNVISSTYVIDVLTNPDDRPHQRVAHEEAVGVRRGPDEPARQREEVTREAAGQRATDRDRGEERHGRRVRRRSSVAGSREATRCRVVITSVKRSASSEPVTSTTAGTRRLPATRRITANADHASPRASPSRSPRTVFTVRKSPSGTNASTTCGIPRHRDLWERGKGQDAEDREMSVGGHDRLLGAWIVHRQELLVPRHRHVVRGRSAQRTGPNRLVGRGGHGRARARTMRRLRTGRADGPEPRAHPSAGSTSPATLGSRGRGGPGRRPRPGPASVRLGGGAHLDDDLPRHHLPGAAVPRAGRGPLGGHCGLRPARSARTRAPEAPCCCRAGRERRGRRLPGCECASVPLARRRSRPA